MHIYILDTSYQIGQRYHMAMPTPLDYECVFIYHFTSLLYYHSTTRYNFVCLKATHKISPLEELVGGRSPPSSSQRLTGMYVV
jgi:hypothetical protein